MKETFGGNRSGSQTKEILTLKEVADYLQCHASTLYRLIKRGDVPHFRLGSDFRFQKSTIDSWIKKKTSAKA